MLRKSFIPSVYVYEQDRLVKSEDWAQVPVANGDELKSIQLNLVVDFIIKSGMAL